MSFTRLFAGADVVSIRDDGRTVDGRIVPYGEVVDVIDTYPGTDQMAKYQEQFLKGSLARVAQIANRRGNAGFISLNLEHDEMNLSSRIGYAKSIEDRDDGAYASFRLYESADLPKVLSMLRESHSGLSVKFADYRQPRIIRDVVSHVQVVLEHVAATPVPTYSDAKILAIRDDIDDEPLTAQLESETPLLDAARAFLEEMKASLNV